MQNGAAALENRLVIPQNVKCRITIVVVLFGTSMVTQW